MNDLALHSDPSTVDDPDLFEPSGDGLEKVFFHHCLDFPGLEGVKVDGVLNRDFVHRSRI